MDRELCKPVIEVRAKPLLPRQDSKICIGSRYHTEIHILLTRAADPTDFPCFENPEQLALHGQRKVADFVQKDGPSVGQLEGSCFGLMSPCKRPLFVPKQFTLNQRLRNGTAVHRHEWLGGPRAPGMERLRHQLLAGPGLASHQDR